MTLSYDGHDLESLFICGEPELSILNAKPDFANTTARNGNAFVGMRYGESTVAFTIVATGTAAERRGKFSTLGSWLMVDAPKQLILPDTPDRYYLAVPQGSLDLQRGFDGEYAVLTFTLTDPIAYSVTESSAVTPLNYAYVTFTVGGNAPTGVRIVTSKAYGASGWWDVYAESKSADADRIQVKINPSSSSDQQHVEIDTVNHNAGGRAVGIYSTWFEFEPGEHKIYTSNNERVTVYWRDRWY